MGEQLLAGPGASRAPQLSITDPKVCRSYLVGTCPHDLFTNTKQDLGLCPKTHSEALKSEYENADDQQKRKWGFDAAWKRPPTKSAKRTLSWKQIGELSRNIEDGLVEIQILGELGSVNTAVTEYFRIRQQKQLKEDRERELKALSDTSGPSGHQKLQVCDVCGAYLSRLDNDRRLADHFFGKMHLGYAQMRKTYQQLQKDLQGRQPPIRDEPSGPRGGYDDRDYGGRSGGYGRRGGGGGGFGRRGGGRW
ncbi:unnamed protein product, partial [Aureobasidium pullulans]